MTNADFPVGTPPDTDFHVGTHVDCVDGRAGTLRHLVMDPANSTITHLVVELEADFGMPVLIPRDQVAAADGEHVRLRCTRADLPAMEPFQKVMYTEAQERAGLPSGAPSSLYLFPAPGLGAMPMEGLMAPLGTSGAMPPVVENVVPKGEVVVGRNSTVTASDGEIGHVEDIVTDPASGRLTHLIVRSGHLWATHTFRLPATAVERVEEGNVRLRFTKEEVEAIARSSEEAATTDAANASAGTTAVGQAATAPSTQPTLRPDAASGTEPHLVGLFATREQAEAALDALLAAGFPSDRISAVTAEGQTLNFPAAGEASAARGTRDTAIGAVVGAIAGFGLFGPLLVPFAAMAGGLIGLLSALGANRQQAEYLTERVRSGHYLVVVRPDGRDAEATTVLESAGASDVHRMTPA